MNESLNQSDGQINAAAVKPGCVMVHLTGSAPDTQQGSGTALDKSFSQTVTGVGGGRSINKYN